MKFFFATIGCFCSLLASAQQPFAVTIADEPITAMPGIHSFAFAQSNGKWIFIGGRKNGLHGFLTPFAFETQYANDSITVVDPVANVNWVAPTSSLPDSIREPIISTNMEYHQEGNTLYMAGGYGWKNSINSFITFPTLTAIDVNGLMNAVMTNGAINSYFRQITDTNLAIAGAHLEKMDSTYYLVFGHRFNGSYHELDSLNNQRYSNAVRTFQVHDDGTNISITGFQQFVDTANFHRRDYNLVPQIFPSGQFGFTAFSGVFRYGINRPFVNSVDIKPMSFTVNNSFTQNLSHYDCAVMPVYDSLNNTMHSIFFGGISMYYIDSTQAQTLDTLVPFVKTISRVTRAADSTMTEYALPITMPGYYGSNALFIPLPSISTYYNSIINLNALSGLTKVGYIIGGINSPDANISSTAPESSTASARVFAVYIDMTVLVPEIKLSSDISDFIAYPNPSSENVNIEFTVRTAGKVKLELFDITGKKIADVFKSYVKAGQKKTITINLHDYAAMEFYCRISKDGFSKTIRFLSRMPY